MNNPHHGARLTVHSRELIVARIAQGQTAAEVADAFGVSVRTVRKWLARFRAGGGAALANHASAPARVAGRLAEATAALIDDVASLCASIIGKVSRDPPRQRRPVPESIFRL